MKTLKSSWRFDFEENILFLSPDKGGKRRTGLSEIKKGRLNSFKVKIFSPKLNFKGKIVGVVDDINKAKNNERVNFYCFSAWKNSFLELLKKQ